MCIYDWISARQTGEACELRYRSPEASNSSLNESQHGLYRQLPLEILILYVLLAF